MHLGRAHCACTRHERSMTENTMQEKWREKEERIRKLEETSGRRKQEIKKSKNGKDAETLLQNLMGRRDVTLFTFLF